MMVCFVETLTLRIWFLSVLPCLLRHGLRRTRGAAHRCYIVDGSAHARRIARACGRLAGIAVEPLRFRLTEIRDTNGCLMSLAVSSKDVLEAWDQVREEPAFRQVLDRSPQQSCGRLPTYLSKALVSGVLLDPRTLWRALQLIRICEWMIARNGLAGAEALLFLERRPGIRVIARYGGTHGLRVIPIAQPWRLRTWLRRYLPPSVKHLLRALEGRWRGGRLHREASRPARRVESAGSGAQLRLTPPAVPARLAVDYFGQFNLTHPERYSDLFFWQQSSVTASDLLVVFSLALDPLDERKHEELHERGISAVALHPHATTLPDAPLFVPRARPTRDMERTLLRGIAGGADAQWLRESVREYEALRVYWSEFFAAHDVKVYVSWFKYNQTHCAIADAMEHVGGVTAIYQRAYESHTWMATSVAADVVFGFSQASADIERRSRSVIPYHVTTGYLGDHRFPLLRETAHAVRQTICEHGAQRILGFSDENSADEGRWVLDHESMRYNYAFVLEKVLEEPWCGLVIKPKVPSTLRARLGPVANLLARAEATGRCFVFEHGPIQSSFPPTTAALASDVMIHSHLIGGTAGIETALAGVPTLLLDREGWPVSPLYQLGVGRVVFQDWPALWGACLEHWKRPGGIPGFGDWSTMLQEFDPFRDGRAAERMGTYLQWLLDGFKAGRDRDGAMADAAERYAAHWGRETITHVNCRPRQPLAASTPGVDAGRGHAALAQSRDGR